MIRPLALLATLLITAAPAGAAAPADTAILPPDAAVARVLRAQPAIQAAVSQIRAEEATRRRLEAGPYEWALRLGGQQRLTRPPAAVGCQSISICEVGVIRRRRSRPMVRRCTKGRWGLSSMFSIARVQWTFHSRVT